MNECLYYTPAALILTLADRKKIKLFATSLTIANTYYVLTKYESKKAAREKIRKFKLLCHIALTDSEFIEKALHADFSDFEDALQYFNALASDCPVIITRNVKDFKNALILVLDAESYLKSVAETR